MVAVTEYDCAPIDPVQLNMTDEFVTVPIFTPVEAAGAVWNATALLVDPPNPDAFDEVMVKV